MFELSPHIDKNKIFLVNLSEIEGRLDPVMILYQRKINNYKYNLVPIKNLLMSNPQYGANEVGIDRKNNKEPRYIRITDIDDYGNLIKELGKTAKKINKQYFLENNDIIIARSGNTVGKAYIHKTEKVNYPCFFAGYMIRFKFNPELIYPDFAFIITQLSFYKEWLNAVRRLAGQPNINAEEYKSFKIPLPPKEIQQRIVDLYETAYQTKQQKEKEAERLLNSIDDYLLDELGITLPEKDNSLNNRIFKVGFSEVTGGRFDPKLYDNNTRKLKEAINNSSFDKIALKELVIHSISGDWGIDEKSNSDNNYTKCLVIRATEFDNIFNLKLENSRVKYRYIHNLKLKKMDIQPNDLLIEKSGGSPDQPVGRISIITKKILENHKIGYSNFIHKIRINSKIVNPEYLFYYLKTLHNIKLTDAMQSQTNGIRNLIMNDYFNLNIAIPNLEKQIEIAEHIRSKKEQAKQLIFEAKQVLEQAKIEVEKMILQT